MNVSLKCLFLVTANCNCIVNTKKEKKNGFVSNKNVNIVKSNFRAFDGFLDRHVLLEDEFVLLRAHRDYQIKVTKQNRTHM